MSTLFDSVRFGAVYVDEFGLYDEGFIFLSFFFSFFLFFSFFFMVFFLVFFLVFFFFGLFRFVLLLSSSSPLYV